MTLAEDARPRPTGAALATICATTAALAESLGRHDLGTPLRRETERAAGTASMICVVGEFKQGKSSLINAILGTDVCPVDDDLATSAVTVVEHGERWSALVEQRADDRVVSFAVALDAVPEWVTEWNNPDNVKQVDRVRVSVPNPLLGRGITLVDTPGAGGLGAGHAAATLGFLPFADALLFVSDASAELSAPEAEFLRDAVERCPIVVMVQTKTDMYGSWRQIVELNRAHLSDLGIDIPIVPLSSNVRTAALRSKHRELNARSGFPELFRVLDSQVLSQTTRHATERAVRLVESTLDQIAAAAGAEAAVLRSPDVGSNALAELELARTQLEHLKGPAARWQLALNDQWADLSSRLHHEFRAGLRHVTRMVDDELEGLKNAKEWDDFGRRAQAEVGRTVADLFGDLITEASSVRAAIVQLVRDEQPDLQLVSSAAFDFDVSAAWLERQPTFEPVGLARRAGRGANEVVDTLRGAQSGLMVLSLLQTALPAAGMAVLFANPFLLAGLGLWSGGRTLLDQRKRRIAQQRQQVRLAISKMVDDVSFEVGDQLSTMLRRLQAELREQLNERFNQLLRGAAELTTRLQQQAGQSAKTTAERAAVLDRVLADVDRLRTSIAQIGIAA